MNAFWEFLLRDLESRKLIFFTTPIPIVIVYWILFWVFWKITENTVQDWGKAYLENVLPSKRKAKIIQRRWDSIWCLAALPCHGAQVILGFMWLYRLFISPDEQAVKDIEALFFIIVNGYFICDYTYRYANKMLFTSNGAIYIAHHTIFAYGCYVCFVYNLNSLSKLVFMVGLSEVTNIVLDVQWFMQVSGVGSRNQTLLLITNWLMFILYIPYRMIGIPVAGILSFTNEELWNCPWYVIVNFYFGMLAGYAMNIMWFQGIVKKLFRGVEPPKKKGAAGAKAQ